MKVLPVKKAHQLTDTPLARRWLIKGLWGDQAVGIIGGEPKYWKSFLVLDIAVSVSTGTKCLNHFPLQQKGSVLLFAAEDSLSEVRKRLVGIATSRGVSIDNLDINVITIPILRLDQSHDQQLLKETVKYYQPKLLILDPFVRLHRIDENNSGEVAPILAYLRGLQREFQTAIIVVHHARKRAGKERGGQALRGSSEFHAWGDSNLYVRRIKDGKVALSIEHRTEKSREGMALDLADNEESVSLTVIEQSVMEPKQPENVEQEIHTILTNAKTPLRLDLIRQSCGVRKSKVCESINLLIDKGIAQKPAQGYQII